MLDPIFITFEGDPVLGRLHATLIATSPLSSQQLDAVEAAYLSFRRDKALSIAPSHWVQATLPDGTPMVISSVNDADEIQVFPRPEESDQRLPHGLAVRTNWAGPRIFRRITQPTLAWKAARDPLPQFGGYTIEDEANDNLVYIGSTELRLNHTLSRKAGQANLWDYKERAASTPTSTADVLPFSLVSGARYSWRTVHLAWMDKVYGPSGVLYTAQATPPIRNIDPEDPTHMPPATTGDGKYLILQHYRQALVSLSSGIYFRKHRAEKLRRSAEDPKVYEIVEAREPALLTLPLPVNTGGTAVTLPGLGEAADKRPLHIWTVEGAPGASSGYVQQSVPGLDGRIVYLDEAQPGQSGAVGGPADGGSTGRYPYFEIHDIAARKELTPGAAAETTVQNVLALPEAADARYVDLRHRLNYLTTIFWRSGTKAGAMSITYYPAFPPPFFGDYRNDATRRDLLHSVAGNPAVSLELGWLSFKVLEGQTAGDFIGKDYFDTLFSHTSSPLQEYQNNFTWKSKNYCTPIIDPQNMVPFWECVIGSNINSMITDFYNYYWSRPAGNPRIVQLIDKRPRNTGSYTLTSRHVLDYDHKGRFLAAVKVVVVCAGAEWEEGGAYEGSMVVKTDPTYTITLSLETNWDGVVNSTTLFTGSAQRPAFEFRTIIEWNPYYYGTPNENLYPVYVRMPPNVTPGVEALAQLKTIATHQGMNPNLACADVREDLAEATRSTQGIEFSTEADLIIRPHTRYVTGQLYARTFKLDDFPDALWLLRATRCDATMNPGDPLGGGGAYHYHPGLAAALNETRHLEVRDGVHTTWSDEFPEVSNTARPEDPKDRQIKLSRV